MKKNNLQKTVLAALVLTSGMVYAEDQYPAANFQPTVVFQDEAYIANDKTAAPSSSQSSSAGSQSAAADDKYPAADFKPQVVYNDPDYKHAPGVPGSPQTASAGSAAASTEAGATTASDSTTSYWIGLIVMALGGVAFFRSRKCGKCTKSTNTSAASNAGSPGGLTGVAKYLNKTSGTGVSRYLEKHVQSVRASASQAATGVEKYIRNRR